tara:strand:+ start:41 stop:2281 length:2241 start_codon:yes stop_codon:yes gene_type:complete
MALPDRIRDNKVLKFFNNFKENFGRAPSVKETANNFPQYGKYFETTLRDKMGPRLGLTFTSGWEAERLAQIETTKNQVQSFQKKYNKLPTFQELLKFTNLPDGTLRKYVKNAGIELAPTTTESRFEGAKKTAEVKFSKGQQEAIDKKHVVFKSIDGKYQAFWPNETYKKQYIDELVKRISLGGPDSNEAKQAGVLSNKEFQKKFYPEGFKNIAAHIRFGNQSIPELIDAKNAYVKSGWVPRFSTETPLNDMSRAIEQRNKNFMWALLDSNNNLIIKGANDIADIKNKVPTGEYKPIGIYDTADGKIYATQNNINKINITNNPNNFQIENVKQHSSYDEYVKFKQATKGVVKNLEKSIPQIFSEHNLSPKDKFNIYNYAKSLGYNTGFANLHHMFGVKHSPTAGFQIVSGQANTQLNDFLFSKEKGIYTADGPWEKAERQKVLNEWAIKNNIIHFDTKGNSYGNPEHINAYNQNKFNPDMQAKILKDLIEDTVQQNSKTIVTEAKEIHKTQGQAAAIKYLNSNGFNPTDPDSFFKQSQKSLAKSLYQGIKNNATSFLKWGGKKFKVIPTAAAGADYGVSNLLFGMDPIASTLSAAQWTTPTGTSKQLLNSLMMYEESKRRYEEGMGPDAEPYHKAILSGKGMFPQFLEPHKELIEGGISGITKKEFGEIKESFAKDPVGFVLPLPERPELISMEDVKKQQLADWKAKGYEKGGQVKLNTADYIEEYGDGTELIHYKSFLRAITKQLD